MIKNDLEAISLGAGVQSTTMALMAAKGLIEPMPDCAIFADTKWEPPAIYKHLDWLETQLPFPVYRVSAGNLREDVVNGTYMGKESSTGTVINAIPAFVSTGGMIGRHCTTKYKIDPIIRQIRELLGVKRKQHVKQGVRVRQWMGISTDEAMRMKDSRHHYITNYYPLIDLGMSRADCEMWFNMYFPERPPLQKSACMGCPYHSMNYWYDMKHNRPDEFEDACEVDDSLRKKTD